MKHEMRRKDRVMPEEDAKALLCRGEYGILSTVGADGAPYAIPISYAVIDDCIYFHCATGGRKLDNISFESRVCFCVVGDTQPVYQGGFTTYFESVEVFGKALLVEDGEEKRRTITLLTEKYLPDHMEKAPQAIEGAWKAFHMYKITIDEITGKEKKKP